MEVLRKLFLFDYTECDAIKEYLEDMALKGWVLKDINTFLTFEKREPQKLTYSVEVFDKASIFDTKLEKKAEEYVEYCSCAGWELVCNFEKLHIFVSTEENPVPIQTDERIKYQTIVKSTLKKNVLNWIVLPAIFAFNLIFGSLRDFEFFITNYISILSAFMFFIFYIKVGSEVIKFFIWCIKAKRNLSRGKKLPSYSTRDLRRITKIKIIPVITSVCFMIFLSVFSFINKDYFTGLYIWVLILVIFLILVISFWIVKRKFNRYDNITLQIILGFGMAGVIMFLSVFSLILFSKEDPKLVGDKNSISIQGESQIPITLEDIGIKYKKYKDSNIDRSKTIFASSVTYYDNTYESMDGNRTGIRYTVFYSPYKFIVEKVLNSNLNLNKRRYIEGGNPSIWDANMVYASTDKYSRSTIVVYDNYIFSFRGDVNLSNDAIEIIRKKLLLPIEQRMQKVQ